MAAVLAMGGLSAIPRSDRRSTSKAVRGKLAEHQEFSPKVRAERIREHARNREFAERYMAREARS